MPKFAALCSGELSFSFSLHYVFLLKMIHDGEIVGLKGASNGRSCEQHTCCGSCLRVGDLLHFKVGVVQHGDGMVKTVVKAVLIWDGTETCTVGFAPRHITVVERKCRLIAKHFAQIIELYDLCKSASKKAKSDRNWGMASYHLLEDIPSQE